MSSSSGLSNPHISPAAVDAMSSDDLRLALGLPLTPVSDPDPAVVSSSKFCEPYFSIRKVDEWDYDYVEYLDPNGPDVIRVYDYSSVKFEQIPSIYPPSDDLVDFSSSEFGSVPMVSSGRPLPEYIKTVSYYDWVNPPTQTIKTNNKIYNVDPVTKKEKIIGTLKKSSVEYYPGASLFTARRSRPVSLSSHVAGIRGEITRFTEESRRRLMTKFATINKEKSPLFVTLTYPDDFPDNPRMWKRDLDVLSKRLRRAFPDAGFIWRLELLPRQSGTNEGAIAPHYHLLIWGLPYSNVAITTANKKERMAHLYEWFSKNWYEVVGSGDIRHFHAGTKVELLLSVRGGFYYVSKYMAKSVAESVDGVGRFWGVYSAENIPFVAAVLLDVPESVVIKFIRAARRFSGLNHRFTVNLYCDPAQWERLLNYLLL